MTYDIYLVFGDIKCYFGNRDIFAIPFKMNMANNTFAQHETNQIDIIQVTLKLHVNISLTIY